MPRPMPVPVSLLLCDDVTHEARTNRTHLIGLFDAIRPRSFPHRHRCLGAFLALTGVEDNYMSQAVCVAPDGTRSFASSPRELRFPRPNFVVRAFFRFFLPQFRRPGIYRMQFFCENQLLAERPFTVLAMGGNGDV